MLANLCHGGKIAMLGIMPLPRAEHYARTIMDALVWRAMPAVERMRVLDEVRLTYELTKLSVLSTGETFAEFMGCM